MKPPPDENEIEALQASTQGRKTRSKWRVALLVVMALLLLLGGGAVAVESYRQSTIKDSRRALVAESDVVRARYRDVRDWPTWYRQHLPPDCNADELSAWIVKASTSGYCEGEVANWANDCDSNGSRYGEYTVPDETAISKYLADSNDLAREAADMVRHAHLCWMPEINDAIPQFEVLSGLQAFKLLYYRTQALQQLGQWEQLWIELEVALRLVQQWDQPCALLHLMVQIGIERMLLGRATALAALNPPDSSTIQRLLVQPSYRTSLGRELIDYELAFYAQLFGELDPEDEEAWQHLTQTEVARFNYLSSRLNWEERKKTFTGNSGVLDRYTDYLHQLRTVMETPGASIESLYPGNPHLQSFLSIPPYLEQVTLFRERLSIVCSVLVAGTDANPDAAIKGVLSAYPKHQIDSGVRSLVVRVRYSEQLASRMQNSGPSEEEFYALFEPVTLPWPR